MSPSPAFNPSSVDTTGDITLVLGRRTTKIAGHRVHMHREVADDLRTVCDATCCSGCTPTGCRHATARSPTTSTPSQGRNTCDDLLFYCPLGEGSAILMG